MAPHKLQILLSGIFLTSTMSACGLLEDTEGNRLPSDIDISLFEQTPSLDTLDLSQITPISSYVELRRQSNSSDTNEFTVVSSRGTLCMNATESSTCESEFESLTGTPENSFYWTSHPNDVFHYLAVTQNGQASGIGIAEMGSFLGTIDNTTEALLLVATGQYHWSGTEVSEGAIRQVDEGFELIVTQFNSCPAETKGFLMFVSTGGEISVLDTWVIHPDRGFCA